jgi:hypothetical protein
LAFRAFRSHTAEPQAGHTIPFGGLMKVNPMHANVADDTSAKSTANKKMNSIEAVYACTSAT